MRTARILAALLLILPGTALAQPAPADGAASARPRSDLQQAGYEMTEIAKAADGAFGQASEAVAKMIERTFDDLGKPTAYIVGHEGSGAAIVGLRYGKGQLHHKVEGTRTIYWNGPSLGPDVGGDASRTFTLVYNLHDSEELLGRFAAVEGRAYLIGGVSANYHQRGDVILVPIRLGGGWRLGANVGYLNYTKKRRVLPF